MADFDVAIVGGGHNGLLAAGYLAKAGAKVIVLDNRSVVGGACVTEEPWPGYRMPVEGLYLCGSAAHPGGGVVGAAGYNAAQVILEDLKKTAGFA